MKDQSLSAQEAMEIVFQSIHAIKSNALIIGLDDFSAKVHRLESEIKKLREQEIVSLDELLHITVEIEKIMKENDNFQTLVHKIKSFKTKTGSNQVGYVLVETMTKAGRRISEALGKKVRFEVREINPLALEQGPRRIIKEVLLQLVRNSVYHGIEAPPERRFAGKDEEGLISLSIMIRNDKIHIRLRDDGRGLNFKQIRQKAKEMRILRKEQEEDKNALLRAIFVPGFSTVEGSGVHAGRGIGLNLVRDRIRDVKGSIRVQSEPGKGTVFHIFIPLDMADAEDKIS
jgi:two-component system chemotaxis sensor kinase CheA